MRLTIQIDEKYEETLVQILAKEMNQEVGELVQRLENTPAKTLAGFQNGRAQLLNPEDILRIYTEKDHLFAKTQSGTYQLKLRLYEAEQKLDPALFVRISQSELVNIHQIASLDLSFSGTIHMQLKNTDSCFVSRRQVPAIRQKLGL